MSLLERILDGFSAFCHLSLSFFQIRNALTSAEFIGFRGKNLKNRAKKLQKAVLGRLKHRTSSTQTSVLSMQNIRTLCQRSPMFLVFRPKMAQKCLFSDFTIFRSKARRGGFRGHSQPVNDVVQQAGGFRKRTLKNIAHSYVFPKSDAWFCVTIRIPI